MSIKAYALTTLQRLIDFLELKNLTDTQNTVLERIIDINTESIENYCNRRFQSTAHSQEVHDGDGSEFLQLLHYPVISTETFTLEVRNSAENEDDWSSIDSNDYFVSYKDGTIELPNGRFFKNAPRKYRVTYTAGFVFDNVSTYLSDTEAGDVEFAMWKLCADMWNKRKGSTGVASEKIGDYSVSYGTKLLMESPDVVGILDEYATLTGGGLRT